MDTKTVTLQKILQLNEYIKLAVIKDREQHHHPLKHDLTKSSRRILYTLNKNGDLNQRAISKMLNISPQAVSETIKKLEVDNLITKDTTKKETIISLTEDGVKHALLVEQLISNHANKLFTDFNEDELQNVINFINKLINQEEDNV